MKVIFYNILIAATCVVAILTLALGNFWGLTFNVSMDAEQIEKFVESGEKAPAEGEGTEPVESGEETPAEEEPDIDIKAILGDETLDLSLGLNISSKTLLSSVTSDPTTSVANMLDEQVNNIVGQVVPFAKTLMKTAVKALVQTEISAAKEDLKAQYGENTDLDQKMKEEGINTDEIMSDTEEAIDKIFNNDLEGAKDILIDDIRTLITNSADEDVTQAEIDSSVEEFEKVLDESTEKFLDSEGNFTVENSVMVVLKESGLVENEGEEVSEADVATMVREKIMSGMNEEVKSAIATGLKVMGIFILIVIAGWAYLLVKIVLKLFMRNKTVKMTVPRLLGWIPHVVFVGLPMLVLKFGAAIVTKVLGAEGQGVADFLSSGISIEIASLTWVSALCTVILMVISFPYRGVRREARGRY